MPPPIDLHVFILVHGLHGLPSDWDYFAERLQQRYRQQHASPNNAIFILKSACNSAFKTHHGLQAMSERLAKEVSAFLQRHVKPYIFTLYHQQQQQQQEEGERLHVRLILSMVGHSLGGLIVRAVLPLLFDTNDQRLRSATIHSALPSDRIHLDILPCSYMSVSSPHLGSRRPVNTDSPWYQRAKNNAVSIYLKFIIGSTGRELGLMDHMVMRQQQEEVQAEQDLIRSGLLMQMSDGQSSYVQGLLRFPYRTLIGHRQDITVPLCSSTIRSYCPPPAGSTEEAVTPLFGGSRISSDQAYRFQVVGHSGFDASVQKTMDELNTANMESLTGTRHHEGEPFGQQSGLGSPGGKANEIAMDEEQRQQQVVPLLNLSQDEFHSDNTDEVEFSRKMMCDLQRIGWRRLSLDYGVRNPLMQVIIHAIVIGKRMGLLPQTMRLLSEQSADFLVRVLLKDVQDVSL